MQADKLNGGVAVPERRVFNDTRGHVSELLAKCVRKGALDEEFSVDDRERMIDFLRQYGDLSPDLLFRGTDRSGFKVPPGAELRESVANDPLAMHELLDADLLFGMLVEETIDWQPTMFQPIGGMDRIPMAFAQRLDSVIRYGAAVTRIRQSDAGVTVTYRSNSGAERNHHGRLLHLRDAANYGAHTRCGFWTADSRAARQGGVRLRLQSCVGGATFLGDGSEYLRRYFIFAPDGRPGLVSQRALVLRERHSCWRLFH